MFDDDMAMDILALLPTGAEVSVHLDEFIIVRTTFDNEDQREAVIHHLDELGYWLSFESYEDEGVDAMGEFFFAREGYEEDC